MTPSKSHNPYTRIRQQQEEIRKYQELALVYEQSYKTYRGECEATVYNANMDITLCMQILKDVRPWVYPGALDNIVRDHVVRRGVSPATSDLTRLIQDTRQTTFLPIARPVKCMPVSDVLTKNTPLAFGVEEENEF